MKRAIIGAGGFASEVYHSLSQKEKEGLVFFVSDRYYISGKSDLKPLSLFDPEEYEVVVAVGDPKLRQGIIEQLPINTKFFTHIHPSVIIMDDSIQIGEGSVICAGSILTTNIKIGKHAHLNLMTTIGHDTMIGDFFTTAPGAKISGNCQINHRVYVGTNASIREKIQICNDVTIGLNAGVVKNISVSGTYVGVPAKLL